MPQKCYNVPHKKLVGDRMAYSYGDPRKFSKGQVSRAAQAAANGKGGPESLAIINNWRNSHSYILNTFQATLRGYIRRNDHLEITFAQRLKRLSTILDKIKTGRARDLASMHDLAGCRLIFKSVDDLQQFRADFHGTRATHLRVDKGRYDYLSHPKATGYRGIHEVYQYRSSSEAGSVYNNLKIEIQYRTRAQHAWATAVEISDILDGARIKFDRGANPARERFFVLSGCVPELSDKALRDEMRGIEKRLNILGTLNAARKSDIAIPASKYLVLRIHQEDLTASGFKEPRDAIAYRDSLEEEHPEDDIVYVSAQSPRAVADAFRNYFRDAADFVDMVQAGVL
jgi:putative GTP pyrophosphokinase